ncbi:hypothetical protein KP509_02G078100 [Ceratopteris richardii]|uniref:Uncharacterized protein n=1 Tax=Ceratopteris richardii TaxID=49495 RepID=A0A8T2VBG2_CERRI|nr:hypothetical protein KP509_02G078100 [Ceratopteris richardii]
MVKFEKVLERESVLEWQEAYVNYKQLKQDLKLVRESFEDRQNTKPVLHPKIFQEHLLRSFASPLVDFRKLKHTRWSLWSQGGINMIIHQRRSDKFVDAEDVFETEILGTDFRSDVQKSFFERLDMELNKVNKFYRFKEQEYLNWESQLQRQINLLNDKRRGLPYAQGASAENQSSNFEQGRDMMGKSEIHQSWKLLRGSFTELYRYLKLLKDYCALNLVAFGKILKKHDKITGQNVSEVYLRAVECSYFVSSDKVIKLMERVESSFSKHFTKGNLREAFAYLKPTCQNKNVRRMYILGIFSGSSVSLLTIFVFLSTTLRKKNLSEGSSYPQFDFLIFSTLALLFLHLYIYGFNVFIWQRVHINYAVILKFTPGKRVGFCDILLLSTALTTIMLGGMVMQLVFNSSTANTSCLPLTLMLVLFCLLLILPLDICCKSMRFAFLRHLWHIICSPLYQVAFADFFLADQLTSQITAFQNFAWILCYYICRHLKFKNSLACKENLIFENFLYFVSVLPYWWRLMQCLRSWMDIGDPLHLMNAGKYLSALVAVVTKVSYKHYASRQWLIIFIISSTFATCYQLYWDIVVDWGLMRQKSKNPWLRDSLALRHRFIYFIAMGINAVLRLAWLFSILRLQENLIDHDLIDFLFASLEVFRRGLWNFFRLEHEHLKNTVKCSPTKQTITPLTEIKTGIM